MTMEAHDQNKTFASISSRLVAHGTIASIVDSTTKTFGATITGCGTFHVVGYRTDKNWIVLKEEPIS